MNPDSLDWQTDEVPLLSHLPQAPLELGGPLSVSEGEHERPRQPNWKRS